MTENTLKDKTAIVGVGATPYYKRGQSLPQTPMELAGKAVLAALADAGLTANDLDGFALYSMGFDTSLFAQWLGGVAAMALPFYVLQATGAGSDAAILLGAQTVGALVSNPLWGWWGDRLGKTRLLGITAALACVPPTLTIGWIAAIEHWPDGAALPWFVTVFALLGVAGNGATILMALGLIGSGMLAVPILTASGAYAVCEILGWSCSLDAKPGRAKEFYIIITASTLVGLLINFLGINPLTALFWTAVINGFLAPPLLVIIMLIANNPAIMGKRVNGMPINLLGWATTVAMFAAAVGLLCTWGQG